MDGGEVASDTTMCEAGGPFRRREGIPFTRRRELLLMAMKIAEQLEQQTKPYERCLLRAMVESQLETN